MSKKEVSMEGMMELSAAVSYLEGLVKSLKEGKVVVQKGDEFVELTPEKNVYLEIEAKQKKEKEKITVELFWGKKEEEKPEEEEAVPELKISSKAPEA